MRYAFFGTPRFAAIILEKLIKAGFVPDLVVCNPDKPVGRKKEVVSSPVKVIAQRAKIDLWQPELLKAKSPAQGEVFVESRDHPSRSRLILGGSLTNGEKKSSVCRGPAGNQTPEIQVSTLIPDHPRPTTESLYQKEWDFFVVAAYAKIIPKEILGIPKFGVINVHPSILPRHRGPTPIQTAILEGDEKTGVSLILLDEEVDHGPILAQRELQDYSLLVTRYWLLSNKLANLSADLLIETIPKFLKEEMKPRPQDHSKATFTKKFSTEEAFVKYEDLVAATSGDTDKAVVTHRMIRALNPEPGVWTKTQDKPQLEGFPKNKRVKILDGELDGERLILKEIQVEGKLPRKL